MSVERGLDHAVPSAALPRKLAEILRPELASLSAEIVDEIRATIPAYARPLDGPYGRSIRAGVEYAITLFVAQIADPRASKEQSHEVHHRLGQNEMREGRSLDTLQSAYRVGARVVATGSCGSDGGPLRRRSCRSWLMRCWRSWTNWRRSHWMAIWRRKLAPCGALDTWRRRLLGVLLEVPAAPPKAIAELAQLTGWAVPEQASPIAVQSPLNGRARRRRDVGLGCPGGPGLRRAVHRRARRGQWCPAGDSSGRAAELPHCRSGRACRWPASPTLCAGHAAHWFSPIGGESLVSGCFARRSISLPCWCIRTARSPSSSAPGFSPPWRT